MRLNVLVPLFLLSVSALPAFALPGEATAVIAHCGKPSNDALSTSEVTGLPERTLTYSGMRLNFEPAGGGWSFTSGWRNHLPESMEEVSKQMPCFREALAAVAATPSATDPTIQSQTGAAPTNRSTFGIANLWLVLFLVGIVGIFGIMLPRRRVVVRGPKLADRPFQKPRLTVATRFRRRPRVTGVPEQ